MQTKNLLQSVLTLSDKIKKNNERIDKWFKDQPIIPAMFTMENPINEWFRDINI